jgi:hypothetical protein
MGDDRQSIEQSEILDFRDHSLSLLKASDSTFTTEFFSQQNSPEDSLLESGLRITVTDEVGQIDEFQNCRKLEIKDLSERPKIQGKLDPSTYLRGEIWIKNDVASAEILDTYHLNLAGLYSLNGFEGLGLWRILRRLGVVQADLQRILLNLEGVLVRAEFLVETVTMNRKARINISVNLNEMLEKNISPGVFDIPDYYTAEF